MDSFETVVASILQRKGYWTMTSEKVELSKAEKRKIKRESSPRWELDVVAYSGRDHEVRVIECKSFLDSPGVQCAAFDGTNARFAKRYKLFRDTTLRKVVLGALEQQLVSNGFCRPRPKMKLCLAAGKIRGKEKEATWLANRFQKNGWILLTSEQIRGDIIALRDAGYENSVAAIVAKLILRDSKKKSKPGIEADN